MTLFEAAEAGDVQACRAVLASGCDVNTRSPTGVTALHLAAGRGNADVVRVLLDAGADPNLPLHRPAAVSSKPALGVAVADLSTPEGASMLANVVSAIFEQSQGPKPQFEGHTPLTEAAVGGHDAVVRLLLERGGHVDARDREGMTALHFAASVGHVGVLHSLIAGGAEVDAKSAAEMSPLMLAAMGGHRDVVRALLDAGAAPNALAKVLMFTATPLALAMQQGHREVAHDLIASGASARQSPLVTGINLRNAVAESRLDDVRALVQAGADVNSPVGGGHLLHVAAERGDVALIRFLVEAGTGLETRDGFLGKTPLIVAAEHGHEAAAAALLAFGADVHAEVSGEGPFVTVEIGSTALILAARAGHAAVVRMLLAAGADRHAKDREGRTAAVLAAGARHAEVVALLAGRSDIPSADDLAITDAALCGASAEGDAAGVRAALARGANPDAVGQPTSEHLARHALAHAASGGHADVVRILLKAGATVNTPSPDDGFTALMTAAEAGHGEVVPILLAAGADPNARGWPTGQRNGGMTALMLAAGSGHLAVVQALLEAGASIHIKDRPSLWDEETGPAGLTALVHAVNGQHEAVVDRLLDAGAYVDARDHSGGTALLAAATIGSVPLVERLLAAGADAKVKTRHGQTALKAAAIYGNAALNRLLTRAGMTAQDRKSLADAMNMAIFQGKLDAFDELLAAGADINAANSDGVTPVFSAVMLGKVELAERLLALGANPNAAKKGGEAPLHRASMMGYAALARALIGVGANVDAAGEWGRTPLLGIAHEFGRFMAKVPGGQVACARLLIEAGADLNLRDAEGRTALRVAAESGHVELVVILRDAGADVAGLCEAELRHASSKGYLDRVQALIRAGADVNAREIPNGRTALMSAATAGHTAVVQALIEVGADVLARAHGDYCALYCAVWHSHPECVRALVAAGADVNAAPGAPPVSLLSSAISKRNVDIVRQLLEAGASVTRKDQFGGTALGLAASHEEPEAVRLLLAAGADPNESPPPFHRTPLHIAAEHGQFEAILLLLVAGADPNLRDKDGHTPADLARNAGRVNILLLLESTAGETSP